MSSYCIVQVSQLRLYSRRTVPLIVQEVALQKLSVIPFLRIWQHSLPTATILRLYQVPIDF